MWKFSSSEVFLALLALTVRVVWTCFADTTPVSDFAAYVSLSEGMLEDGIFGHGRPTAYRLPGQPLWLLPWVAVSSAPAWLAGAAILPSAALPVLIYRWVRSQGDQAWALASALLVALNPTFVLYSPVLGSEHVAAVLLVAAMILAGRARGRAGTVLAGALLGAACLTRGDMLFYALVPLVAFALASRSSPKWWRKLAVTGGVLALVVGSWAVRNAIVMGPGAGLSTSSGVNLYFAHNPVKYGFRPFSQTPFGHLPEVERHQTAKRLALEHVAQTGFEGLASSALQGTALFFTARPDYAHRWSTLLPRPAAGQPYRRTENVVTRAAERLSSFYYLLLAMAAIGVLRLRRGNARVMGSAVALIVIGWTVYAGIFWAKARYRYIAEVAMCVPAGLVLGWMSSQLGRTGRKPDK